jgi:hypothetical protein
LWDRQGSPARCSNKDCKGLDGTGISVPISIVASEETVLTTRETLSALVQVVRAKKEQEQW